MLEETGVWSTLGALIHAEKMPGFREKRNPRLGFPAESKARGRRLEAKQSDRERMIHAAEDSLGAMMRERTKPDIQAWKVKGK